MKRFKEYASENLGWIQKLSKKAPESYTIEFMLLERYIDYCKLVNPRYNLINEMISYLPKLKKTSRHLPSINNFNKDMCDNVMQNITYLEDRN